MWKENDKVIFSASSLLCVFANQVSECDGAFAAVKVKERNTIVLASAAVTLGSSRASAKL
jgi:hypothetical protein